MTEPARLRVSDEQREHLAQEFREHFAAGRLTDDELSERVHAVYRAQTEDELRALRADLPMLPITPAQHSAELVERRGHIQRRLIQQAGGGLALFMMCSVIWLVSGAHGQFWPVWLGTRLGDRANARLGASPTCAATVGRDVHRAHRAAAPAPLGDP